MKNKKITRKITQGMYILTTNNGGCVVDAVSQISSGDNPLISVAVMKTNYTNELLKKNNKFALSVIGKNTNPQIIKTFGYNSMRDINKFENIETTEINEIKIINDSLGYMVCEIIEQIENDTHTVFIGKMVNCDVFKDEEAMSYQYFQEHKDELINLTAQKGQTTWKCTICGYIHTGDNPPEKCPLCGVDSDLFVKVE